MPVGAPPADRRFRRAQVRPTRRARWRTRLPRLALIAVCIVLMISGGAAVLGQLTSAGSLAIRRIEVTGHQRTSKGEVDAVLADLVGQNIVAASLADAQQKLLALPWVASADVRRRFPSSISVAIVEYRAIGLGRLGDVLWLIDPTGMASEEFGPHHGEFDLPVINGLTRAGGALMVDETRARLAARVMASLAPRPDLIDLISEIDVGDPRNVTFLLKGDTAAVRVGRDSFLERLEMYVDVAAELRTRMPDIDYVDVRYGALVFVGSHVSERTGNRKG
jgi:cell division protein FtsQ